MAWKADSWTNAAAVMSMDVLDGTWCKAGHSCMGTAKSNPKWQVYEAFCCFFSAHQGIQSPTESAAVVQDGFQTEMAVLVLWWFLLLIQVSNTALH